MVRLKKEDLVKKSDDRPSKFSFFNRLQRSFSQRSETKHRRKADLKTRLDKAGLRSSPSSVSRFLFIACILVNIAVTIYAVTRFYDAVKESYIFLVVLIVVIWTLVFAFVTFVLWVLFYLSLDIAIFKRKQKLEEVLPDFLQLASSNLRAGMTIDQALWFSIRPRFGVLAKEIEEVAKRTFAGESLDTALTHLVKKYDSKMLERSMNLLIEGLRAGGEIGDLLNKIASNIQETNIMKKEMAANVTTYVIFISFATVFAAPFLFGMAYQLITVIREVFSRIDISPAATSGFPISVSEGVIDIADFRTFAVVSLIITSLFSAIIVSTIKKGNIKAGIKYIPAFMISALLLFFIVVKMFSFVVEGFF
jgi:Flp pilus assembly protein TadB